MIRDEAALNLARKLMPDASAVMWQLIASLIQLEVRNDEMAAELEERQRREGVPNLTVVR